MTRKRVVIIGGGFGGMTAARFLREAEVILIDRTNTMSFNRCSTKWPLRHYLRATSPGPCAPSSVRSHTFVW